MSQECLMREGSPVGEIDTRLIGYYQGNALLAIVQMDRIQEIDPLMFSN